MHETLDLDDLDVAIQPLTADVAPSMHSQAVVTIIIVIFL
jgi:hypothetical protein